VSENFGRIVIVTIDETLVLKGFHTSFKIEKSLTKDPNKLDLEITNLSEASRNSISTKYSKVVVEAGYVGNTSVIFRGDMRHVFHSHNSVDWVTKIECGDGEKALRSARVNMSVSAGETFQQFAQKLITALGVPAGNALAQLAKGNFRGGITQFVNGAVATGLASKEFDKIMRDLGLTWSIQDGQLQVLPPGEASKDAVVVLTPKTGLIGSPVHGEKNNIKITSLLSPAIRPGTLIRLSSRHLDGDLRAEKVQHVGDTAAQPWYTTTDASVISVGEA
jgi:hypothetical protein